MFVKTDNVQYTIVGEIDRTVSSAYNGYPAYGWLNLEETPKDASVVVYTQTKNPRKIYETVPQIAQAIGLEQDEYGEYPYRYHTALLGMYGIYEPGHFWSSDLPKLFLSLLIVAVASMTVFAYIIRGAFSISAKRKIKELGILKSIGMTPKQIRRLVKYEARWLSFFPIVISIGLGHLLSYGVLTAYSKLTREVTGNQISVSFSPWIAIISIMLSFLTVLLAASGPARQPYQLIAKAKKLYFSLDIQEKCPIHTSKKNLEKILSNLLSNAVSYTNPGHRVTVVLTADQIEIRNECVPIPREKLHRVFEPFYRPDFARDRKDGGNGLGLYIVDTLSKALELSYKFEPMENQSGMCFTLFLS